MVVTAGVVGKRTKRKTAIAVMILAPQGMGRTRMRRRTKHNHTQRLSKASTPR